MLIFALIGFTRLCSIVFATMLDCNQLFVMLRALLTIRIISVGVDFQYWIILFFLGRCMMNV